MKNRVNDYDEFFTEKQKQFLTMLDRVKGTEFGFQCGECGRIIETKRKDHTNHRGRGFMMISMESHLWTHVQKTK